MGQRKSSGRPRPELGVAGVARLAGVSTATVSNTLNRPDMVAPATRQKVLAAIAELDYVPNRAAGALRKGTSHLIGLVLPDIVNPFYAEIAKAVCQTAAQVGYGISLCHSDDDPERERQHFAMLAELRAAGAIVIPLSADAPRLERLRLVGSHVVLVDRRWPTDEGCSVVIDDIAGGRLAVDHLLTSTGATSVTIVNGPVSIPQCLERDRGARTALVEHGIAGQRLRSVMVPEMTIEAGRVAAHRLADGERPRAVFCTNDQLAVGVVRGLSERGIVVPTEVAVVGYGDLPLATESLLPLSSVGQPKADMGRTAVELFLAEQVEERDRTAHTHRAVTLSPELVVRDSAPNA